MTATAEAPAAQATPGATILTEALSPQGQQPAAPQINPAQQPENGIDAARQAAQRPEWVPEKYWKADKNEADYEGLAKGYTNLEKLLGRDKVPGPLNDEDQEGWDRWYSATGRPEAPDKYEFKRPDKLPDGMSYDEEMEKSFREFVHKNGLNKRQAANIYDGYVKQHIERHTAWQTAQVQAKQKVEQDLRREHGAKYDAFLTSAKTAVQTYADPEFNAFLSETGLGNDPRMIRFMGRVGSELRGETRLQGKPQPQTTPLDAQRAISEHRNKYGAALMDKSHPDHGLRVKEMQSLFEAAYPEGA